MVIEYNDKWVVGFVLFFAFYEFNLGFSEGIFLTKYTQYISNCQSIWEWVIGSSVINILGSFLTFYAVISYVNERNDFRKFLIYFSQGCQFITILLIASVYYNTDQLCRNFWESNAPELWDLIFVNYIMFLVCMIIIILMLFVLCVEGLISCFR